MENNIERGDKTIKLSINFWTNNVPTTNLKTCWDTGSVHAVSNRSRGIVKTGNPIPFNSFNNPERGKTLLEAITDLLKKQGITVLEDHKNNEVKILIL